MADEIRVESWGHFSDFAGRLDTGPPRSPAYLYRGQAKSEWRLVPSLLRLIEMNGLTDALVSADQALVIESLAVDEFCSQAHLHIPSNVFTTTTDVVSWMTLMQHHGAPTRLLDWTRSIYVAAYFAVTDCLSDDGAVWIVHVGSVSRAMSDEYGGESATLPDKADRMKGFMQVPSAPEVVLFMSRKNTTRRMVAQQGFFSMCRNILGDQGKILEKAVNNNSIIQFKKLVIPFGLKVQFARRLRAMNLTASALFPGLDGLARSVSELVLLESRHCSK